MEMVLGRFQHQFHTKRLEEVSLGFAVNRVYPLSRLVTKFTIWHKNPNNCFNAYTLYCE
jgi:hypothetical protein